MASSCASTCRTTICGLLCAVVGTVGLLAVFLGVLGGVYGWDPSCVGEFKCSALLHTLEYEDVRNASSLGKDRLKIPLTNGMVRTCKYGHVEAEGTCKTACDGTTRTAPCRCQTREEAETSLEEGARKSLYVSIGVVLLGIGLVINLSLSVHWFFDGHSVMDRNARNATEVQVATSVEDGVAVEGSMDAEDNAGGFRQRCSPCLDTFSTYASIAGVMFMTLFCMPCFMFERCSEPPRDENDDDEANSPASSQASSGSVRRALERARAKSHQAKETHPKKVACMLWFFPCIALGFAAWGAYELLGRYEGEFYDHLETTIAVVGIVALATSAIILLYTTLRDHPMACVLRTIGMGCVLIPLVGVAGIVWSAIRMSDPADVYHACDMGHCIFGLC